MIRTILIWCGGLNLGLSLLFLEKYNMNAKSSKLWFEQNWTQNLHDAIYELFPVQTVQTKFDAKVLHDQPQLAAESGMVDDGKGAKEIFRVDRFDLLQVRGSSIYVRDWLLLDH